MVFKYLADIVSFLVRVIFGTSMFDISWFLGVMIHTGVSMLVITSNDYANSIIVVWLLPQRSPQPQNLMPYWDVQHSKTIVVKFPI